MKPGKNIRLVFSYTYAQGFNDSVTAAAIQVPAADPITGQSFTLDVDGDGKVTAFVDGLMVIHSLFHTAFQGEALTNKALSNDSPYWDDQEPWLAVASNIDLLM